MNNEICKRLEIICKECFSLGLFPWKCKKGIIVPIHKRGENSAYYTTDQYRYFSFVGKFCRDLFLTKCSKFLLKNKLIATNQYGFKLGDSSLY